eukprot:scaffold44988_cov67-Phaeocystis_antarctica.AAC.1
MIPAPAALQRPSRYATVTRVGVPVVRVSLLNTIRYGFTFRAGDKCEFGERTARVVRRAWL